MSQNKYFLIFLFVSFITISNLSFSQVISAKIDKAEITIGDRINYSFTYPYKEGNVIQTSLSFQPSDTVDVSGGICDTIEIEGKNMLLYTYYITSFIEGKHIIPPIILNIYDKAKDKTSDLFTDTLSFEVKLYPIDTTKIDIKDIKPNIEEPFSIKEIIPIILIFLGVLVFIILVIVITRLYKKYRKINIKEVFVKPVPKLPAHINALNSLENLKLKQLIKKGYIKEFYSELSDILRAYLNERYLISAMEMTSDEIFFELSKLNILEKEDFSNLKNILVQSDLVKFAKYVPDSYISEKCIKESFNFVNSTKIEEKEEEAKNV